MKKSVDNVDHPSTSKVQKEIEKYILDKCELTVPDKNKFGYQIDGWKKSGDEIKTLVEIYTSLGSLTPGGRKKILADMFKLISYVKVYALTSVELQIILTSEEVANKLNSEDRHNSWIKKAIEAYGIKIKYFQLPDNLARALEIARELQKEGIKKTKNEKL